MRKTPKPPDQKDVEYLEKIFAAFQGMPCSNRVSAAEKEALRQWSEKERAQQIARQKRRKAKR